MAAVCEEGAALGHASSAVALANLARIGNRDVVTRYNLRKVIEGARQVTKLTTGAPVAVRQPVYGPRAIEAVFGFTAVGGGVVDQVNGGEGLTYIKFAERFVDPYLGARHNTFGVDLGDAVRDAVRRSFDLDGDRDIDWDEYRVWLVWALRSTQDAIHSVDDLFSAVVRRGILPGLMAST